MKEKRGTVSRFAVENSMFYGGALLAALLFIGFRLPVMMRTGLAGQGYLCLPLSFYAVSLMLTAFVVPAAAARMISVRLANGRPADALRLSRTLSMSAAAFGIFLSLVFWLFGNGIARFAGMPLAGYALRLMGPALFFMGLLGVLRGYILGSGAVGVYVWSVILEQVFSGIASLFLSGYYLNYGDKANLLYGETGYTAAYGAKGTVLSLTAGALVTLVLLYLFASGIGLISREANEGRRMESSSNLSLAIERSLLPASAAMCIVGMTPVISTLIFAPRAAGIYGAGAATAGIFGAWSGMTVYYGIAALAGCALLAGVLPAVAEARAQKNRKLLSARVRIYGRFAVMFALFACAVSAALYKPLANLFFAGEDTMLLQRLLCYGSVLLLFLVPSFTKCGVLFGLGHYTEPLKNALLAFLLHLLALLAASFLAKLEMFAVLLANGVFLFAFFALNTWSIRSHLRMRNSIGKQYVLPALCAGLSYITMFLLYRLCALVLPAEVLSGRLVSAAVVLALSGIAFCVYFFALALLRTFTRGELLEMPLGIRLYRFAKRSGLL